MPHQFADDSPNYLEESGLALPVYLERAAARLDGMFRRLKAEYRGVLKPLTYEAYLVKLEGVLGLLHRGDADGAQGRMSEIEAELVAELPYPGDPAQHRYRDDEESWADYGVGYERHLEDTALRLDRLEKRLRGLKGTLPPNVYEVYSRRLAHAIVGFRGDCLRAIGTAEEAMRGIRAELAARVDQAQAD